jgi:hypothetical protein
MIERARRENRRERERQADVSCKKRERRSLISRHKKEMVKQREKRGHETRRMPFGL